MGIQVMAKPSAEKKVLFNDNKALLKQPNSFIEGEWIRLSLQKNQSNDEKEQKASNNACPATFCEMEDKVSNSYKNKGKDCQF